MKKFLLLCLFCFAGHLCAVGRGADPSWTQAPDRSWHLTLESALEQAKNENKKVYVLKTGSDWCGWCVRLYKDVLSTREFKRFARSNLVVVYLDYPRRKKQPQSQKDYFRKTTKRLRFGGGYPSAIVLDSSGRELARRSGYSKLPGYMDFLKNAVSKSPQARPARSPRPVANKTGPAVIPSGAERKAPAPIQPPAPAETQPGWLPGPSSAWHIKLETALEEARRTNKKIFALKTGSDWCSWCVKLYNEVLSRKPFLSFASKNLVLLYLDFPNRKSMPPEQSSYNRKTVNDIGASGGYPTAVILDKNGRLIKKFSGFAPSARYIKRLRSAL